MAIGNVDLMHIGLLVFPFVTLVVLIYKEYCADVARGPQPNPAPGPHPNPPLGAHPNPLPGPPAAWYTPKPDTGPTS